MPTLRSRRNFAGIDSRPGSTDNILNSASDMRNVQLRDKAITKRLGHQKIHDDAVKCASVLWDGTTSQGIRVPDYEFTDLPAGTWSFEFAFRYDTAVPAASVRNIIMGPIEAQIIESGGSNFIEVGYDTGGGAVLPLVGTTAVVPDTDYFVSVTFDDTVGGGTIEIYLDGSADGSTGGLGSIQPSGSIDLIVGEEPGVLPDLGKLYVGEIRIWADTRTSTEISTMQGRQLTAAEIDDGGTTDLKHYWQMGEGGGDTATDLGDEGNDMQVCYDPFQTGIVDGSDGSLRVFDIEKTYASNTQQSTSWQNWFNGDNVTWQLAVKFDQYPTDTAAWEYAIIPMGSSTMTTSGMILSLDSPGASSAHRLVLNFYHPTIPGEDLQAVYTFSPVIGQTYDIAAVSTLTGGMRDIELFVDGVSVATAGPAAATSPAAGSVTTGLVVGMSKVVAVAAGVNDVIDYTVDDIKTWDAAKSAAFVADNVGRTLYETDLDDDDLAAYWKLDENVGRTQTALFSTPRDSFNSASFVDRPDAQFFGAGCPLWSFGLVTCADPCIRGS